MNRKRGAFFVVLSNMAFAFIICLGWGLFAGIKGGVIGGLVLGLVFGFLFSIPFLVYFLGESVTRPIYWRLVWSLGPFLFISLLLIPTSQAGMPLFLQLSAVVIPSLFMTGPWTALAGGLIGGFVWLLATMCVVPLRYLLFYGRGDNWPIIYPSVILFVAFEMAFVRGLIKNIKTTAGGVPT